VKFYDLQLKRHYEKVISLMTGLPEELRPICALLDAWQWYKVAEGEHRPLAVWPFVVALLVMPFLSWADLRHGVE
jgi:hypothetical protein